MNALFSLPIGFSHPWLLLGLALLPALWWLMRVVPPAPVRRIFPATALLAELDDEDSPAARSPWWLLLLRTLLAAALILAAAGPVLHPRPPAAATDPLLIVLDDGWAAAPDWLVRMKRLAATLEEARDRPVALIHTADPRPAAPHFTTAEAVATSLAGLAPLPWNTAPDRLAPLIDALAPDQRFSSLWISDGLASEGRQVLLEALQRRGKVEIVEGAGPVFALTAPWIDEDGRARLAVLANRPPENAASPDTQSTTIAPLMLEIHGRDPAGRARLFSRRPVRLAAGATRVEIPLDLPPEIAGRIERFQLGGIASAGAVSLAGVSLARPRILIVAGGRTEEAERLLSPAHYLGAALREIGPVARATLADAVAANPDVIVLADIARIDPSLAARLGQWVEKGGQLIRFAGPRMAAATLDPNHRDPLLPVALRPGDRALGGAMSWAAPRRLKAFGESSPFYGISLPQDVAIHRQILAQPGPEIGARTVAMLEDGTPLVTRRRMGEGALTLFHVAATPDWSSLPLSRLFLDMLARLATPRNGAHAPLEAVAGRVWRAETVLDGFGRLESGEALAPIPGERLGKRPLFAIHPGIYAAGEARLAVNLLMPEDRLEPASWPAGLNPSALVAPMPRPLAGPLLLLVLALLALEGMAVIALRGGFRGPLRGQGHTAALALVAMLGALLAALAPAPLRAQDPSVVPLPDLAATPTLDEPRDKAPTQGPHQGPRRLEGETLARALKAARTTTLGYLPSGNKRVDEIAAAGLEGLAQILEERTSVEPGEPIAVDPEADALAPYPLLYWPITATTPLPSTEALARLDRYLATGGMIVFDTRDADIAGPGIDTPARQRLRLIAGALDIPPLAPVPRDHVLTRSFYLLNSFPGRFTGGEVWVEAPPPDAERLPGAPFRRLNDGVSPVLIGANDWIGAWAMSKDGWPLLPVGAGYDGEMQREMATRFGVNLVMYVLTGNYKSDQVHVPALLQRLGQ